MKRFVLAVHGLAAGALTAATARAETPETVASPPPYTSDVAASVPPATPPGTRSKLFAEATLGPGLFRAKSGQSGDERSFSGTSLGLALAVGSRVCNVAIGGAYLRDHIYGLSAEDEVVDGDEPELGGVNMTFSQFGVFTDVHLSQEPGPRLQALIALASIGVLDDRSASIDEPNGLSYGLGAGYDFRVSPRLAVGALIRLTYASLHVEESSGTDVSVLLPSLAVSVTLL